MPHVTGVELFRDAMAAHEDSYVLIGGGACSLLFDSAGLGFRATKDLDIVILTDKADAGFARDFWSFVVGGGYECGRRSDGRSTYYRFQLPQESPNLGIYPVQMELFARHPDFRLSDEDSEVAPLPFDEVSSSLSAIILDDGYYVFIQQGVTEVGGIPLLDPLHIIPLKMRAHVDNAKRHGEGMHVNEKDLRKHRADVVELARLLAPTDRLLLEGQIRSDAEVFFADFEGYAGRQTRQKTRDTLANTLGFLREVYL